MTRYMARFGLLLVVVLLCGTTFLGSTAFSQTTSQPSQSLRPTPSACGFGSQSVRVCSNGLQSCNDVCAARALSANSEIVGCETACCNRFNVCVQMRNCGALKIDCN